jgi:hypothetical protein
MIEFDAALQCDRCDHWGPKLNYIVGSLYRGNLMNGVRKAYRKAGWIATTRRIVCPACKEELTKRMKELL